MQKLRKIFPWIVVALVVLPAVGITATIGWRPFIGPQARTLTALKFDSTPARMERGDYLVNHVLDCMECHSEHDWTQHDAPIVPGTLGSGQDMNMLRGLPGQVSAPNITPDPETGAGTWSDDQFARAIREGVGHDGRALFPFMPYLGYRNLSDEDLASVIVYLRSLPPIKKERKPVELIFPVKYLIRAVPQPLNAPVPEPDVSTPEKRGKYLASLVGCADCHTPQDAHGQPLPGMEFGGGLIFDGPWGRVASANLTSDPSGIPYYDAALFTQTIRTGSVKARQLNQIMPWHAYRGMTDEDLTAVFAYVKTAKPVRHHVDNTLPPTYCKICRGMHGGGDQN